MGFCPHLTGGLDTSPAKSPQKPRRSGSWSRPSQAISLADQLVPMSEAQPKLLQGGSAIPVVGQSWIKSSRLPVRPADRVRHLIEADCADVRTLRQKPEFFEQYALKIAMTDLGLVQWNPR